ncbi:hypothetical protein SAMN04487934_101620 [Eubacterium ruminantium]|nr:hypothetical protein SAMN04487934_101620 [Eubacterium ruminantium]
MLVAVIYLIFISLGLPDSLLGSGWFLTILGLVGFSLSGSYWILFIFAVPYGLGAGSIDASVNHYVANHYKTAQVAS